VLLWAGWGGISPASLRGFLRAIVRWRDRSARDRFADGQPCEWRIPGAKRVASSGEAQGDEAPALSAVPDLAA